YEEALVLRSTPYRRTASVWLLPFGQSNAELCWQDEWQDAYPGSPRGWMTVIPRPKTSQEGPRPTWNGTPDLRLTPAPVAPAGSNLYFFVKAARSADEKNECQADLVCLDRDSPKPLTIPLKFDLERGSVPGQNVAPRVRLTPWATKTWM